jgi:hypothetical protein
MKIKLVLAAAVGALALGSVPAHADVALKCQNGSGDVVAHPIVYNTSRTAIPAGTQILYYIHPAGFVGRVATQTHVLASALMPGKALQLPKSYPWNFTCNAVAKV